MIVFIFIVVLEMLIFAFRGPKKNAVKLVCNIGSAVLSGLITFLFCSLYRKTFTDFVDADLTFGGNLADSTAETLESVITSFGKGLAFSVFFTVMYVIIRILSNIVAGIIVRDKNKKGFNAPGVVMGLVSGIICAGILLTPLTGLQQIFPDRKTAKAVSETVSDTVSPFAGTAFRLTSGPTAERTARYAGIGILTDLLFNKLTTAKTDAGEECLVDFVRPFLAKLDEAEVLADAEEPLSERIIAGSKVLNAFSSTKLFKEKEKVAIIENIVLNNVPELDSFPEYRNISQIADDISYAGRIVEVFEGSAPALDFEDIRLEDLKLTDPDIDKLADNLYSMNAGPFFVNYLLNLIFQTDEERVSETDFASTKPAFADLLKTAMMLRDALLADTPDIGAINGALTDLRSSPIICEDDYDSIVTLITDNYSGDEIPDDLLEYIYE